MDINNCQFVGRLADDPTYHPATATAPARTTARLLVNRPPSKGGKESKQKYDTVQIVAWGVHAETMANHTHKGKEIGVICEFRSNSFQDKDTKQWKNYAEFMVTYISLGRDSTASKVMKAAEASEVPVATLTSSDLRGLLNHPEVKAAIAREGKVRASAKPEQNKPAAEDPFK